MPVITIAIPLLSQNSMLSLSLMDPPGCIMVSMPLANAISTQSLNGKNASEARTAPFVEKPKENRPDIEEMDPEITDGLTITFVENMKEVLSRTLV